MIVKIGNWIFKYRNIIFPFFYAALFIPSPGILPEKYALIIGALIIAFGILVRSITIGLEYIIRGGYKGKIHAKKLVTGGIYSVCRNPMYLGNISLILGFGFFANSLLFLLLFFPLFVFIYHCIIKAEEKFLTGKFGDEYVEYKTKVNALLPHPGNIRGAFQGYQFNWKRVMVKEYNSLYTYFIGILLLLLYKETFGIYTFLIIGGALTVVYVTIKIIKKVNKLGKMDR
jgi:protein-S-isoprenylcysteine O-methyltransferase Ste14